VPVIQLWYVQSYWYVPGTVNVCVQVAPPFMFPESKAPPAGALVVVTVWCAESLLVHVTVLLTPMTKVMASGV
jgi:hypothetical protein